MSMTTPKRVLLVEGKEDVRVIPELMEKAGVSWVAERDPVVHIKDLEGADSLLAVGEIETQLKASGLSALGVMIDADEDAAGRWQSIRARISASFPLAPTALPPEGVVLHRQSGPSFGAWIMPNNTNSGMLETFLLSLRPKASPELAKFAATAVSQARVAGAPFRDAHRDKAEIHTWLAWQDPPGRQIHQAIMQSMLREPGPTLNAFVSWFCRLYSLAAPVPCQSDPPSSE